MLGSKKLFGKDNTAARRSAAPNKLVFGRAYFFIYRTVEILLWHIEENNRPYKAVIFFCVFFVQAKIILSAPHENRLPVWLFVLKWWSEAL